MNKLTSDPHAWLRPVFARLASQSSFRQLAPSLQFEELLRAIRDEHPREAALMREWNEPTQRAFVGHLAKATELQSPVREQDLWTVSKNGKQLKCIAVYLLHVIDLRLMEPMASDARSCSGTSLLSRREPTSGGPSCESEAGHDSLHHRTTRIKIKAATDSLWGGCCSTRDDRPDRRVVQPV